MRVDIFCKVVDNHGDVGVCWRLASTLAAHGETVRLWIDEPSALSWMAPAGCQGVKVVPWHTGPVDQGIAGEPAPDVLIEAFGCDPAPELLARFAEASHADGGRRPWINLEYLSAERYVERLHGLPSPVFKGPGAGLTKHFFYPGFTERTGGLIREHSLVRRRHAFDRTRWLRDQGIVWHGERVVTLFCYEPAALPELLASFERDPVRTRLLVTPGRAARAIPPGPDVRGALSITWLPYLPQDEFDHLLWAGDLNFVRGEDSVVRAFWAGTPFIWQIYPQDDDAHHAKLDALLDWMDAPATLRCFHHAWNGTAGPDRSHRELPVLDPLTLDAWRAATLRARDRLESQDDLRVRLLEFIAQKR